MDRMDPDLVSMVWYLHGTSQLLLSTMLWYDQAAISG